MEYFPFLPKAISSYWINWKNTEQYSWQHFLNKILETRKIARIAISVDPLSQFIVRANFKCEWLGFSSGLYQNHWLRHTMSIRKLCSHSLLMKMISIYLGTLTTDVFGAITMNCGISFHGFLSASLMWLVYLWLNESFDSDKYVAANLDI